MFHYILAPSICAVITGAPLACASSPPHTDPGKGTGPLPAPIAATTSTEPSAAPPAPPAAPAPPAPRPVTACDAAREELWVAYRASRERACRTDSECVVAISPNSWVRELATVVHVLDSSALVARARAHIEQCGSFAHYEPNNAIRVVRAVCGGGHCAESEIILHVED